MWLRNTLDARPAWLEPQTTVKWHWQTRIYIGLMCRDTSLCSSLSLSVAAFCLPGVSFRCFWRPTRTASYPQALLYGDLVLLITTTLRPRQALTDLYLPQGPRRTLISLLLVLMLMCRDASLCFSLCVATFCPPGVLFHRFKSWRHTRTGELLSGQQTLLCGDLVLLVTTTMRPRQASRPGPTHSYLAALGARFGFSST